MQVSFGQFIPVVVNYNSSVPKKNSYIPKSEYKTLGICDYEKPEEIIDSFVSKMSKREKNEDSLTEQQRRVFRANISDYVLPSSKAPQSDTLTSEVQGIKIKNEYYLVTGQKDLTFLKNNDLKREVLPVAFERDLINYIKASDAKSKKTIHIWASDNPKATTFKHKYKIDMIDFYNSSTNTPISGEKERCK